jgi:Flp pilus assembly protein CpaB
MSTARIVGLGQTVTPEDLQWQSWPAATASNIFIRRNERPDATTQVAGSIARAPFIAGEPIRKPQLIRANGSGFMAAGRKHQHGPLRHLKRDDDTEVTEGRPL